MEWIKITTRASAVNIDNTINHTLEWEPIRRYKCAIVIMRLLAALNQNRPSSDESRFVSDRGKSATEISIKILLLIILI